MLTRLTIRDIVLIDSLDLDFESGLSVFTGETGAGKSILLDALSLALGSRGDAGLVREGAGQGEVTATFDLSDREEAKARLSAKAIDVERPLTLMRVQMADGRTRASLNERPVGVQALRDVARELVEIHAQHDDRALLDAAEHRALVDAFGDHDGDVQATREAYRERVQAEAELAEERRRVQAQKAEEEFARHALDELVKAAPRPGEERELAEARARMQQGEKVAQEVREALEHVTGGSDMSATLSSLCRRLERRAPVAPSLIEPCVKALGEAIDAVDAATRVLEAALDACDFSPEDLERCEERLFALRALARKHAVASDDLPAVQANYESFLANLSANEARLAELERRRETSVEAYRKSAAALSRARVAAARRLESCVNAELPSLKLEQGRFHVVAQTDQTAVSPEGFDRVEFHVQTNPGTRPGALIRIASGGELSRFLLALKVALTEKTAAPTLIFDEIDAGVGGAVADAIGQRLANLSTRVQVLAVTHAPQVAARADHHFKIVKTSRRSGARPVTSVRALDADTRREEVARMLAGAEITNAARAAARSLIEGAA